MRSVNLWTAVKRARFWLSSSAASSRLFGGLLFVLCTALPMGAEAQVDLPTSARELGSENFDVYAEAIEKLGDTGDARALTILEALDAGALRVDESGNLFVARAGTT